MCMICNGDIATKECVCSTLPAVFSVSFAANDVGGSLCFGGVFNNLKAALKRAGKIAARGDCLCDPHPPWVEEYRFGVLVKQHTLD
jgi:hypothetical protein